MRSSDSPETTIVIRALNEERWLPEVLRAIQGQRYRDFELLLVDSGSTDRTREIARDYGARIVELRPEDFTYGYALNLGASVARGSLIAIVSAHAIPTTENWLEQLVVPLRMHDVAMVVGRQRGHAVSKFSEARDFERVFPETPQEMNDEFVFANNANAAVRRDLWEKHPFNESLPGLEDAEWAMHWLGQGMRVLYEPEPCVFHVHTESWPQVRQRFYREGVAGRWAKVRIVRNIPGEIWREARWCCLDLLLAARERRLALCAREIAQYRYHKSMGIVSGILDSRKRSSPLTRAEPGARQPYSAVVIRGPHRVTLEKRAIPALKPGEVLVRIAYQGICATDLEILEGRLGYYRTGLAKYPIVPGHECSGTVVAVGRKVATLQEGDRVVVECIQGCGTCAECGKDNAVACLERKEVGVMGIDGGYAEYLVARARYAHRVPASLTLAQAALAEPLAVVLKGLDRLGGCTAAGGPKRCAVIGAGTIGHLAARVLALRGHSVSVYDREPTRLALLQDVAVTCTSLEEFGQFEWIVEATGDQALLTAILERSAAGATLLLLGLPYAAEAFSFESVVAYDRAVIGSVGSRALDVEAALVTLQSLDTRALLQASFPLEQFERAWDVARSGVHLKVMLKVDFTNA